MADDSNKSKSRTKQALLGELESIKSLLDDQTDDIINFDDVLISDDKVIEPPILTSTVEEHEDADEDIPVLTEAFDAPPADDIEAVDIEIEEGSTFVEPEFEQWPDDDSADVEVSSAGDLSLNDEERDTLEIDHDDEEYTTAKPDSLFDDLEKEFAQHFDEDANDDIVEDKSTKDDRPPIKRPVESAQAPQKKEIIKETKPSPEPKTVVDPLPKRGARETQPSLFDEGPSTSTGVGAVKTPKNDKTSVDNKTNTIKPIASVKPQPTLPPLTSKPLNSENPFLPKHIRDRLHTNRSLQDELTSMNSLSSALGKSSVSKDPDADKNQKASSTSAITNSDQLVDELIKHYLPKIEQELRQRLREQLIGPKSDDSDQ